ncbi:hypothetical protein V7128_13050 [Neobacillus vireti]|uniref:hypothetical protein n=1 Tax=Neobacillus vireti TaxID=220686 RepID=UPI0030006E77
MSQIANMNLTYQRYPLDYFWILHYGWGLMPSKIGRGNRIYMSRMPPWVWLSPY